jgi:2-oxo-4-hydroxy-4-carboxy--5-ureidoimidazoline (OHCU) decarboxylase
MTADMKKMKEFKQEKNTKNFVFILNHENWTKKQAYEHQWFHCSVQFNLSRKQT